MNAVRRELLRRAAACLEANAAELERSHTRPDENGAREWDLRHPDDRRAARIVEEHRTLASALRRIAETER